MYNYFSNERNKHIISVQQHLKQSQQKQNLNKLQNNKKLLRRYMERATNGYERMVEADKQINNYKEYQHQFRNFDKNKNIGPPSFYFKSRNQRQRIKEATKQNQDLDEVPFFLSANPSHHIFRETKSKNNFKFTSYDTASRVIETVQNMKTNEVPTSWNIDVRGYLKNHTSQSGTHKNIKIDLKNTSKNNNKKNAGQCSTSQRDAKSIILPTLNIKHHPKSLQSIKNGIELGPLKDALQNKNQPVTNNVKNPKIQRKSKLKLDDQSKRESKKKKTVNFKSFTVHVGRQLELDEKQI